MKSYERNAILTWLNFDWLTPRKAIVIIMLIGFLVYFNALFSGFVWDDDSQIVKNKLVHSIGNFPKFFLSSTFSTQAMQEAYYKPLLSTTFSFVYTIFGSNAFIFHLSQLILHTINAILVYILFIHFLNKPVAFFLAILFLVHPINVESVSYISAMQEPLFFLFGMVALLLLRKSSQGMSSKIIAIASLLLSLLSKETGFLFLVIGGAYTLLFKKRNLLSYLFMMLATLGMYFLLRFGIAGFFFTRFGDATIQKASLSERFISMPKIILYYLKTFLWPTDLAISQDWVVRSFDFSNFYLPLLLVTLFFITIVGFGVFLWHRDKKALTMYSFFFLWFIAGLGLHAQIFPLDMTVAERWFYFPMVGILGVTGVVLQELKVSHFKIIMLGVALIILLLLSARTIVRNLNWKDNLTLFSHDARISKDSPDLENNLGSELFKAKKYDEAQVHYENSIRLAPKDWAHWQNLGVLFEQKGETAKAKESYQKAIENGNSPLSYAKLANLLYLYGSAQETLFFIKEGVKKQPNNAQLWLILALVEYELGNQRVALPAAQKAHELSPTKDSLYVLSRIEKNLPIEFK